MKELFYTISAAVLVFFGATSFAHFVELAHNS
jgi:hypothetical protein